MKNHFTPANKTSHGEEWEKYKHGENSVEGYLEKAIKQKYENLSKAQKKVAKYILNNQKEIAFLSCKAIAERTGVSDATVIRTAYRIVPGGYGGLKKVVQTSLTEKRTPSQKLESTNINHNESIYQLVFRNNIKNVRKAEKKLSIAKLDEVVKWLDGAKRVYFVGGRRAHTFAFYFYYNLSRMTRKVRLVEDNYGLRFDSLREMDSKDVMVTISFRRYSYATYQTAKFAKERKCFIIALTDSILSPIGQIADITLEVDFGSPFFFGSYASTLVVIEAIIGGLSLKHKQRDVSAMKEDERRLKNYGVWLR